MDMLRHVHEFKSGNFKYYVLLKRQMIIGVFKTFLFHTVIRKVKSNWTAAHTYG